MPRERRGQQISFGIVAEVGLDLKNWIWVTVRKGDTVASIAAGRGHRDKARQIADKNKIRSVNSKFSGHARKGAPKHHEHQILVPGVLRESLTFDVLAGDDPPVITDGYANFGTVDRPERVGLTVFEGYGPITMDIPIRFESDQLSRGGASEGAGIEADIAKLERMAGRGTEGVSGVGPPPIVHIEVTGSNGEVVPLLPLNLQHGPQNPQGPQWRVTGIDWDSTTGKGVLRNKAGNRIRQLAVVAVQQHTPLSLKVHSVTVRAKAKPPKKKTKGKK